MEEFVSVEVRYPNGELVGTINSVGGSFAVKDASGAVIAIRPDLNSARKTLEQLAGL